MTVHELKLKELKRSALESCKFRGHTMKSWEQYSVREVYTCHCKVCGKYVTVTLAPHPNEIDIGGPAVALSCTD